jgi:hypothetical protein
MPKPRETVRDLYQEFGCTAVIRPFTYRDEVTGETISVTISPQYSILMPGVASGSHHRKGEEIKPLGGGGGGGGGAGADDPLIAALIQKLPPAGTDWSTDERIAWLQLMVMGFQVAYGPKEQISVSKEAAN